MSAVERLPILRRKGEKKERIWQDYGGKLWCMCKIHKMYFGKFRKKNRLTKEARHTIMYVSGKHKRNQEFHFIYIGGIYNV